MYDGPETTPKEASTADELAPGRVVASYVLGDAIATGGVGRIYRAWDKRLNRAVAIKILAGAQALDKEQVARFHREVAILAKLSHPSIVRVLDAGEIDGRPFFAMELVQGLDLEKHVESHPSPPEEVVGWLRQVALGVGHLHREGLLHRDIKPANILLRPDGNVTLVDFGLAQTINEDSSSLTQPGVSIGTPAFMAPEQAKGERDKIDERTDIFQLGATLFALLVGRPPQIADSPHQIMMKVAEAQGPDWHGVALPKPLRAIITKAMAKHRNHRYTSVAAMDADLARWQSGEWVKARRDPVAHATNFFFRRLALPILILALGAAMTIAVVMVDEEYGNEIYTPISIGHSGAGLARHVVGGEVLPTNPNAIRRKAGPAEAKDPPWIGVSSGGRLTWGDASTPSSEGEEKLPPAGVAPTPLGRGDFSAGFGIERTDAESVVCFLSAPWNQPLVGLAFEVDWKNSRLRAYRRSHVTLDLAWPQLRNAPHIKLNIERHARHISLRATAGNEPVPSIDVAILDEPTSARINGQVLTTEDQQLGVVTKGRNLLVNELTYQQHAESASFAENLYALGVYDLALGPLETRLGVLRSRNLDAAEERHLHFMRGECLHAIGGNDRKALEAYQLAIDGSNDLEAFYARMAVFEILLDHEMTKSRDDKRACEIPESLDLRIRALTSGEAELASIYALRLAEWARQALPSESEAPHELQAYQFSAAFKLIEAASSTVYGDAVLRLRIHQDFLREATARAETPTQTLDPAFLASLKDHYAYLARVTPIRTWGAEGAQLFAALPQITSLEPSFLAMLRGLIDESPVVRASAPELTILHYDYQLRRLFGELAKGIAPRHRNDAEVLKIALSPEEQGEDPRMAHLFALYDLFSPQAMVSAKAEQALRGELAKGDTRLLEWGFETPGQWQLLLANLRYRTLPEKNLYANALREWASRRGPNDPQSPWIDGFLASELERLNH